MSDLDKFLHFITVVGRKLSEINPGSDEVALKPFMAIEALDLVSGTNIAVLGGDVLSDASGRLACTYDNFYCNQLLNVNCMEFARRSHAIARESINKIEKKETTQIYLLFSFILHRKEPENNILPIRCVV
jgi:hypothetical protein